MKTVIFVSSAEMGQGNEELGRILTKNFFITLSESENLPDYILLVNSGVQLIVEDSPALEALEVLADKGVQILACGTCADFYKIKDKIKVGSITNMFTIKDHLMQSDKVISL